ISAMGLSRARCATSRFEGIRGQRKAAGGAGAGTASTVTAQTLYSGILEAGSTAEFVRKFAAESASLTNGTKTAPGRTASVSWAHPVSSPRRAARRPGMVGRWTGPLQAALAVEARVGEPAEDRGKPRHLGEDLRRAPVIELPVEAQAEPAGDALGQLAGDPPVGARLAGRREGLPHP